MKEQDKKPLNHREMMAMELVYALQAKVDEMDKLEGRMRQIGVWQYYKPCLGLLTKVTRALLDSLCDRNLRHMEEVRTKYLVHLTPRPVIGSVSTDHIVSTKDLQMLCDCASRDKCQLCLNDVNQAKKCQLRSLLLQIAPPDELRDDGLCDYAMMKTKENNWMMEEDE